MTDQSGYLSEFHRPVMIKEVLELLNLEPGFTVVDATLGGAGHALLMLQMIIPGGELIGIDRDMEAIMTAMERLSVLGGRIRLINGELGNLKELLSEAKIPLVDAMLADLGVSSHQLDASYRGFSFREDAPLDMRMNTGKGESAAEFIARLGEDELENIIREYGEERYAKQIAKVIAREQGGIDTTKKLADAVLKAVPSRAKRGNIHPATRTFQAIRIAVNDELGELERFLNSAPALLKNKGRLAVISYHSLEDRRVKQKFRELADSGFYNLPVRKCVKPAEEEVKENPRARSAKLRVIEKCGVIASEPHGRARQSSF